MQLGRPSPNRPAPTVAHALRQAAEARGHRPAITVLGAGPHNDRRDEQSYASLMQWVAKGAHLLEVDVGVGPGDLVHVDAPAGWMVASVCLAVWWTGAAVTDDRSAASAAVVHEGRAPGQSIPTWTIGDALDGTPAGTFTGEAWAIAVQSFPDHPPPTRAMPDALAVAAGGRRHTHADLLAATGGFPSGRLGVRAPLGLAEIAVLLAARPAVCAEPVVLIGTESVDLEELVTEKITGWA